MEKESAAQPAVLSWERRRGLIGHWLKRAYVAMRRRLENELRQMGLTHSQWTAMGVLYDRSGLTHSELEQFLLIEAPSLTSLVKGMEKRGWVVRRQHPEDARVKLIELTELGRKTIEPALQLGMEGEEELLQFLSEEELEQAEQTLRKIALHLE